ncbi:hypothetical protein [Chitinophaga niabensis]|uniref:Outer membrane protein beta-barrel domain-containing protein n=1 Tax=Chitinophaga niabensis TaxID=536979 RepID=A0A1N6JLJ9_9BACT|nr:hypothetical protein [Chitinophaga niabensis]SIO44896.1 hypothetical protein SAMN04488055_4124 [Chitinophaga niabensis]
MRLKNLQLGPSFSLQAKGQDTSLAHLGPITKDPLHFPNWDTDTMRSIEPLIQLRLAKAVVIHVSLLSTWEFYNPRKKGYDDRKELKIGVEYSYVENNKWSMTGKPKRGLATEWDDITFRRTSAHLGLYSDFVFRKRLNTKACFYLGAGASLAYTISGRINETKGDMVNYKVVSTEKYEHLTHSRRDISILLPIGFDLRGSGNNSRLGMNIGMRPGVVFIKETMYTLFTSPVMGLTIRFIYNLH